MIGTRVSTSVENNRTLLKKVHIDMLKTEDGAVVWQNLVKSGVIEYLDVNE